MEVLKNDKYNTLYNREGKVSLLYNLTPCSKCQPLQVMQPLRAMAIYTHTLTTSSASQVLIDTCVGKGILDSCYVRNRN